MGECKLVKKVSTSADGKTKFTNFYLVFPNVDRKIPITQAFREQKSDFIMLCNLADYEK